MKKIPSFTIDHNRLLRGIYVSRKDILPGGDTVTTFDIRMTEPNRQKPLSPESLHAMEHLAATYLRNREAWSEKVIYWGPMGCCTGNYLVLAGDLDSTDILELMRDTMRFVAEFEGDVPGATPADCGNYSFMDLQGARLAARNYLNEVLVSPSPQNLVYPS